MAYIITLQRGNLQYTCATTLVFPSSRIYANRAKKFAIMAAGPPTLMRSQIKRWHKSSNVVTGREHLKHPDKIAGLGIRTFCTPNICGDHIVTTLRQANLVASILALQRWNLNSSLKNIIGRFTSHINADRLDKFELMVLVQPTPVPCPIQKLKNRITNSPEWKTTGTRNKNRSTGHRNIFTNKMYDGHILDKSLFGGTNTDAPTLESALQIHINAGRFPSARVSAIRAKTAQDHDDWT